MLGTIEKIDVPSDYRTNNYWSGYNPNIFKWSPYNATYYYNVGEPYYKSKYSYQNPYIGLYFVAWGNLYSPSNKIVWGSKFKIDFRTAIPATKIKITLYYAIHNEDGSPNYSNWYYYNLKAPDGTEYFSSGDIVQIDDWSDHYNDYWEDKIVAGFQFYTEGVDYKDYLIIDGIDFLTEETIGVDFTAMLLSDSTQPRIVAEFHFQDEIRYVSDQKIGIEEGFDVEYEPIVKSWGTLRDNVRIDAVVSGDSIEARQLTLSILNIGDTKFNESLDTDNIENIKVYIYQWFADVPASEMKLIDTFICQDPINYNEASSTIEIQLVSVIMGINDFIVEPGDDGIRYDLVVGTDVNCKLEYLHTGLLATLSESIPDTSTGDIYMQDWTGHFSQFSGKYIAIDSEIMYCSAATNGKLTISERGARGTIARPHSPGARIYDPDGNYDYAACSGPVSDISGASSQGVSLSADNTIEYLGNENPAKVRFKGRPPFLGYESGEPSYAVPQPEETKTYLGFSQNNDATNTGLVENPNNILNYSGLVTLSCDKTLANITTILKYGAGYGYDDSFWPYTNHWDLPNLNNDYTLSPANVYWFADSNDAPSANPRPSPDTVFSLFSLFTDQGLDTLGSLAGLSIETKFGCYVRGFEATLQLVLLYDTDKEEILYERESGVFETTGPVDNFETTKTFNLSSYITSWALLATAKIEARLTVTRTNDGAIPPVPNYYRMDLQVKNYGVKWFISHQPDIGGLPTAFISSEFDRYLGDQNRTLQAVSCKVKFNCDVYGGTVVRADLIAVIDGLDHSQNNIEITSTYSGEVELFPDITSYETLQNAEIKVKFYVTGPSVSGQRLRFLANVNYVLWSITEQPPDIIVPAEQIVVWAQDLSVFASSNLPTTPPGLIRHLLESVGNFGSMIDVDKFLVAELEYDLRSFEFKGLMSGSFQLHDALKYISRMALLRIIYNAGLIRITSELYYLDMPVSELPPE